MVAAGALAALGLLLAGCEEKENPPLCGEAVAVFEDARAGPPDLELAGPAFDQVLLLVAKIDGAKGDVCDQARRYARQIETTRSDARIRTDVLAAREEQASQDLVEKCREACPEGRRACRSKCKRCTPGRPPHEARRCESLLLDCYGACDRDTVTCKADCEALSKSAGSSAPPAPRDSKAPARPGDLPDVATPGERVDLSQPRCREGGLFIEDWTIDMPHARVTFQSGGFASGSDLAYKAERRLEIEVTRCDKKGGVQRLEESRQKDRHLMVVEGREQAFGGPLHGQVVVAERKGKKHDFVRALYDGKAPTEAQAEELLALPRVPGYLWPKKPVKVGHRWSLSDDQKRAWSEISKKAGQDGRVDLVLEKIIECDEGRCAFVRVKVDLTTTEKRTRAEEQLEGYIVHGLTSGKDHMVLHGPVVLSEYVEADGKGGRVAISGDAAVTLTTR